MNNFNKVIACFALLICTQLTVVVGQGVTIGLPGGPADNSAVLDVRAGEKGVLLPRMESFVRTGIFNPAVGLTVFDSTTKSYWYYNESRWVEVVSDENNLWQLSGSHIVNRGGRHVGVGVTNPSVDLHVVGDFQLENGSQGLGKVLASDGSGKATWANVADLSQGIWGVDGTNIYNVNTGGVAIGKTIPTAPFDLASYGVIGGVSVGSESTHQGSSIHKGLGFLTSPWIYTNVVQAQSERGVGSTLIAVGNDGVFSADDEINLVTNGVSQLVVGTTGDVEMSEGLVVNNNVQAADFDYSTPKNRYYSVSAGDWQVSSKSGRASLYSLEAFAALSTIGTDDVFLKAPVHLPEGANVTQVDWLITNGATVGATLTFARYENLGTGRVDNIDPLGLPPGGYFNKLFTQETFLSSIPAPVQNAKFNYMLVVKFSGDSPTGALRLGGVVITYTVNQPD